MAEARQQSVAYLGMGGNLGDPRSAMAAALRELDGSADVQVVAVSSLYRTPPWGKTDQPDFLNAVARLTTGLLPHDLLQLCLDVEQILKRVRLERWGPRVIDLDILWFDGLTIAEPGLSLPHPRMLERAFVILPLAEIAPELMLAGQTAKAHASAIDKTGIVKMPGGRHWWRAERNVPAG